MEIKFPVYEEAQLFINISYICWRILIFTNDYRTGKRFVLQNKYELYLLIATAINSIYNGVFSVRFMFHTAFTVVYLYLLLFMVLWLLKQDSQTKIRYFLIFVFMVFFCYMVASGSTWVNFIFNAFLKILKIIFVFANQEDAIHQDPRVVPVIYEEHDNFSPSQGLYDEFGILRNNGLDELIIYQNEVLQSKNTDTTSFCFYMCCVFGLALWFHFCIKMNERQRVDNTRMHVNLVYSSVGFETLGPPSPFASFNSFKGFILAVVCLFVFILTALNIVNGIDYSMMIFEPNKYNAIIEITRPHRLQQTPARVSKHNGCNSYILFPQCSGDHKHTEYRYQNEDARFVCQWKIHTTKDAEVLWKVDGKYISNSAKYQIKTSSVNVITGNNRTETNNYPFIVRSTLDIYRVQELDFCTYQCNIKFSKNRKPLTGTLRQSKNRKIHSFGLQEIKQRKHVFNTYPGGSISIDTEFFNFIHRDELKNFQNDHLVNSRRWLDHTSDLYLSGCSPLTLLFMYLNLINPHIDNEVKMTDDNFSWKYSKQICMHPRHAGLHEIQIINSSGISYQTHNKKEDEIQSFAFYLVGPITSKSQMKYSAFENSKKLPKSLFLFDLQDLWMSFQISWLIRFSSELLILIFVSFVVICGIREILKVLYFKIKFRYYRHLGLARNGGLINHIMVLNSEEDNDIVDKSIVQPLEMLGKKVCFPGRDFAEQGNMPEMTLYQNASEKCSTFILVLTKSLMESRREWRILFEYVLAVRKKELEIEDTDVVIISMNHISEWNKNFKQLKRTFPTAAFIDFKQMSIHGQRNELINVLKDK